MANPWEQDWGGNTATEAAPWEQSWSDSPTDKPRPTVELEPVPSYLTLAARADSGIRKAGLNIMRMADAAQEFLKLPAAVEAVGGGDAYQKAITGNLAYYNAREAQLSQQDAALDDNSVAGQLVEGTARALTELPIQLVPGMAARNVAQAVKVSAGVAGGMGGLSSYGQDRGAGKSDAEAIPYALASGGITAATTLAFGASGAESIFKEKVAGTLRDKVKAVLVGIGMESAEEMTDQVQQDFIERVARNRDKPVADSFKDVLMAGGIGGLVGGGVTAVGQVSLPRRANAEAKTLEAELKGEVGTQESRKEQTAVTAEQDQNARTMRGIEQTFNATAEEAGDVRSPVDDFLSAEQERRSQTTATTAMPEPMPWEMEYEGGEIPGDNSKFEIQNVKTEQPSRNPSIQISPVAETTPAPIPAAPSRAATTSQAASAPVAGDALTTETPRAQSVPAETQKTTKAPEIGGKTGKVEIKVKNPYGLAPENEKIQTVTGKVITLPNAPGHEFVVYSSGKYWRVVERSSGQSFGNESQKTQTAAIASAEKALASVKPGLFDQVVRDSQKLNPAAKPAATPDARPKPQDAAPATPVAAVAKVQETPEIKSLQESVSVAAAVAGRATEAWGKHSVEVVDLLRKQVKDAQAEVNKIWNDFQRTKPEYPGKQKLTKKKFFELYGFKSDIEANAAFNAAREKLSAAESSLQAAETELNRLDGLKNLSSKHWSAATTRLKDAQAGGLEAWADKQLAIDPRTKTRGTLFGLDPAEEAVRLAAVAIKGSYVIARGVRDFAAWSAEMIRQLPELANATAEQLRALYARSVDIAEGRDPEIGQSVRGMKVKADTNLSDEVRELTEAAYQKRVSADDVAEAKRLVQAAGGPEAAAVELLQGLWKSVDMTVQVKAMGEIMSGLATLERRANDIATQERLADLQVRVADHSTKMATTPAQWLQAFASLYANYSPAAWLKEWRNGIASARRQRLERVTGRKVGETPTEMAQEIAVDVANDVREDAPTTAAVIDAVYGGKGKPGETATQAVERIIGAKGEKAQRVAKKIQDFYEKEVNKFKKKHKIPELTPEDQRSILADAKAIERLPADSLQRREAVLRLLDSLHRRKGFERWELPVAFWYANVLSGPTTHAKNILGNSVNLGMEAGMQALLKPTNIPVILESLGRSLSVGAKEAWSILRTGHDTAARHGDKFELRRNPMELQSGALDKILLPWKLVGRFLRAEDAVFFNAGQEMRAAILTAREKGGDVAAMREAMGWTPEARTAAEAQATAEGLTGLNYQRRVNEIIEQGRSETMMNAAREFGYDVTFNNDPYGVLGAFTNEINKAFAYVPILKPFILPFTRIVANVTNSSLNWTPVGTYRALRGQRKMGWLGRAENSGKLYGREINDPLAIRDAHARAMLGTAAIIGVTAAAIKNIFDDEPQFMVTGSGPADKEQRDALRATGWIPFSVRVGNRYYSYADKPPQLALAMVGHYLDAIRYKNLGREDALNRFTYALNGNLQVLLQSSWLQGLSSLFNQANKDSVKSGYKGAVQQVVRTSSGFVVPTALRQLDQYQDPTRYTADDVQSMLIQQVPWARRSNMPDLNAFGETIASPSSKIFWSNVEGNALAQRLAGQRVFPSVPNQGDLTAKEHYALVKFRGPLLKEMLATRADEWMGAPRLLAQDAVNRISAAATSQAKSELGLDEANR